MDSLEFCSIYFTFHLTILSLSQTVKLNRISQPISIEYKMVHGLQPKISKCSLSWFYSRFKLCFRTGFVE